jgi:hypothetical protein
MTHSTISIWLVPLFNCGKCLHNDLFPEIDDWFNYHSLSQNSKPSDLCQERSVNQSLTNQLLSAVSKSGCRFKYWENAVSFTQVMGDISHIIRIGSERVKGTKQYYRS